MDNFVWLKNITCDCDNRRSRESLVSSQDVKENGCDTTQHVSRWEQMLHRQHKQIWIDNIYNESLTIFWGELM